MRNDLTGQADEHRFHGLHESLNSQATGSAGENLKGSTVTARACVMGTNLIDAGGL